MSFECGNCSYEFKFNQLNVKEREDKITYECPVCSDNIYETALNRNETS